MSCVRQRAKYPLLNPLKDAARDAGATRAVRVVRVGTVCVRQRMNDERRAVLVEDAEIAIGDRDAACQGQRCPTVEL